MNLNKEERKGKDFSVKFHHKQDRKKKKKERMEGNKERKGGRKDDARKARI